MFLRTFSHQQIRYIELIPFESILKKLLSNFVKPAFDHLSKFYKNYPCYVFLPHRYYSFQKLRNNVYYGANYKLDNMYQTVICTESTFSYQYAS